LQQILGGVVTVVLVPTIFTLLLAISRRISRAVTIHQLALQQIVVWAFWGGVCPLPIQLGLHFIPKFLLNNWLVLDWYSRKVLSWRLSNTMDASFCVEALEEALRSYGQPEIFNSDQGSQFTSFEFTELLCENGIRISKDGKGRWMDNVFIERLWRSLKYECVYLSAFETGQHARQGIGQWLNHYNETRPHSVFGGQTPHEVYYELCPQGHAPEGITQAA